MDRAKRAISDLVHLQVPMERVKRHQRSDQEHQPLNISRPIIESPASYRSRSFESSLLIPRPEAEINAAVRNVETAPANVTHSSPFRPMNPLQMSAPLVRDSHGYFSTSFIRSNIKSRPSRALGRLIPGP